ncbi:fungal-specific transcription factor domain-containing protein [Geopyxis carbonaria]|nr:fungal-specific transcription factor domain-containing protein [Geopyxis carbonaria]
MAMLDRRLKRMEERLLKNVPKEDISAILASTGRSVVKPSANPAARKRTAETAFDEEVDSWSRQQGNAGKHRNLGGMGGMDAELQNRITAPTDSDDGSHALPSKEIQEHLAEVFFECIYGQPYFLLHKPSFMRRLKSGTAPPVLVLSICAVSARFSPHPAVAHQPAFLAGEKFASEARRQLLKNFDTPNITNLTVCIILGLHEFGTCHGGRSWALGGMATRMAHALQLHKEPEYDPMLKIHPMMKPDYMHEGGIPGGNMSFTDKEIRRRCMWACFVMDRFNSSGTERPCVINENEVEIQLPVHDQNLHLDSPATTEQLDGGIKDNSEASEDEKIKNATDNMGIGAYMIRVVAMYGRVVKYLNQGGKEKDAREMWDPESHFSELNSEIHHFSVDLPDQFQYTPENLEAHAVEKQLGQFIFLHVAVFQIRLFLHRSALTAPGTPNGQGTKMPPDFASRATEIALDAATKIAVILQESQDRGVRVVAPFTGYCAFNASLVHLVRMFYPQKRIQQEAKRHMETCLRFLLQLKQYWGLFCSITDNLKMLYRRFQDAVASGGPLLAHQEASRMLQYGDWFLKYPAGLSTSDFEDSTTKSHHSSEDVWSPSDDPALSHRPDLQTADEFFARLGPRQHKPASMHQKKPKVHGGSPTVHSKSPASIYRRSPAVQRSPQNNPIQNTSQLSPMAVSTPTMIQTPVDIPLKPDTQIQQSHGQGHGSQININQQPPYGSGSFSHQDASQLSSPMSAGIGNIPTQNQFSNYTHSLPPGSQINNAQSSFERTQPVSQHQQQHQQQSYLYDSYPAGSDSSLIAALSTGLWQGFDQPINTADLNTFPEQTSSAWFMPFNSCPPGFEPGGMGTVGLMGGGGGGAQGLPSDDLTGRAGGVRTRAGPEEVGEGDASHIMSVGPGQVVPGGLPSPATYHSRGGQ